LRQGVIFDLAARHAAERAAAASGEDIREGSVRELQRRFMVDAAQATRVAGVAAALLAGVQPKPNAEVRRELRWAAALHEIGMMISHHDHHRHSAYVLAHADAAGFSQSQLRRIGDLVLGQRGGLRKLEAQLSERAFALHLLCLRLAVIVCHARDDVDPGAIALVAGGEPPAVTVKASWAEAHPRALHLLREEIEAWARAGLLLPTLALA
jgi:exopolyphosphatase/guanosine-5'-triphosphate,3'-diphosphate pyrophosphatase